MSDEISNLNEGVMSMDADGQTPTELEEGQLEDVSGGICGSFSCRTYSEN